MKRIQAKAPAALVQGEWKTFPGGELEARPPKALCPSCREALQRSGQASGRLSARPLCFQCYRVELDRTRALKAAGDLDTGSPERFQSVLPLEPVNVARLERLRLERRLARAAGHTGAEGYAERRHQAQIAARHTLERAARQPLISSGSDQRSALAAAAHAAELQLPEAWLPFVMAR